MSFISRLTRSNRGGLSVAALLVGLFLSGCEADTRSSYVEPKLANTQLVTLNGGFGYYITEMDGDRVDSANLTVANWGSNSLKVTPGHHEFRALFTKSSMMGNRNTQWLVSYNFKAGHTYHFGCASLLDTSLTITDEQTGETKTFDSEDDYTPADAM